MLDILNKGTGIVKPEVDPTTAPSTSTTSTSSALNKNSVAQVVVKYLTKYLHDKRIKDKVKKSVFEMNFVTYHLVLKMSFKCVSTVAKPFTFKLVSTSINILYLGID